MQCSDMICQMNLHFVIVTMATIVLFVNNGVKTVIHTRHSSNTYISNKSPLFIQLESNWNFCFLSILRIYKQKCDICDFLHCLHHDRSTKQQFLFIQTKLSVLHRASYINLQRTYSIETSWPVGHAMIKAARATSLKIEPALTALSNCSHVPLYMYMLQVTKTFILN